MKNEMNYTDIKALRAARIAESGRLYNLQSFKGPGRLEILAELYETNWTPPESVDPDLLAARAWLSDVMEGSGQISGAADVRAGKDDEAEEIRAYLDGCTRGREGAKALVEALEDMCALVKQNTYPQPDKPDTPWGRLQRALAVLASAKRGG